jgi:hypothetical protein
MKKFKKLACFCFSIGGILLLTPPAFASTQSIQALFNPINPIPVASQLFCPTYPICDLKTEFLLILTNILRIIPILSVFFIIVGGFRMTMSQGNEEALGAAKRTIVWAVLGLVFALLSFSIIAIVQNFLGVNII